MTDPMAAREANFHNAWAIGTDPRDVDVEGSVSPLSGPECQWIFSRLPEVKNRRVLDLGCGLGEASVYFAMNGALVTAVDISPEMCSLTTAVARLKGVDVQTLVASAMDLSKFESETFDLVYGANVLHHVDIERCIGEVKRVLRPGGRAIFWDPVQYNPVINVYRKLASGVRTIDEHPLRVRDLRYLRREFRCVEHRFFWLSATLIFVRFFLVDRISPSEGRYWKIVVARRDRHKTFLRLAHQFDRVILRLFPPLGWMCWNVAIIGTKE